MQRPSLKVLGLFFASLMIFTWGLETQEIIGFESRFYLFALEMWRHGLTWFPTTYHQPYPDYPGTSTWLIMLVVNWFGVLNKYTAVLPTAIAAALTVTLTYLLGESERKQWGWYAVCMLILTAGFLKNARTISLDMFITCITVICFYLLYTADKYRQATRRRWVYLWLIVGFALRGPIGLVMPASVVCAYYFLSHRYRQFIFSGLIAALLLLICSFVLYMLAWHVGGNPFTQAVLRMEFAGRMGTDYLPVYYYWTSGLGNDALAFPLALLSVAGILVYSLRQSTRVKAPVFLFQLIGWMIIILVGMSIPGDKKIRYILPVMPAAALLATYPLIALGNQSYFNWLRLLLRLLMLFLPGILFFGLLLLAHVFASSEWMALGLHWSALVTLAGLQIASWLYWMKYHQDARLLFFAAAAFVFTYIGVFEPAELYVERGRDFVQQVESVRLSQQASLAFYGESPDGLPIKYLVMMPEESQPQFIDTTAALLAVPPSIVVIARAKAFDTLPVTARDQFDVIERGSLGHVKVVAIKKKSAR